MFDSSCKLGDSLHEVSDPVFLGFFFRKTDKVSSAEFALSMASVNFP